MNRVIPPEQEQKHVAPRKKRDMRRIDLPIEIANIIDERILGREDYNSLTENIVKTITKDLIRRGLYPKIDIQLRNHFLRYSL
jgi:hypothetical protein